MKQSSIVAAATLLVLSGCAPLAVSDPHADVATRMFVIASRFERDLHQGGMSGVITDVEQCYASTTTLVVKVYALRDCLILDYVGYRMGVTVGRTLFHQALPYYEDKAVVVRWAHYGKLAEFDTATRLAGYVTAGNGMVQRDLAQINQGPVIVHHSIQPPLAQHF